VRHHIALLTPHRSGGRDFGLNQHQPLIHAHRSSREDAKACSRLGKTVRADSFTNKRAILQTLLKGIVSKKRADFSQFLI
jgi:hypothetical protein